MENKDYYSELCSIQTGKNWHEYFKVGWPFSAFRIYPEKIAFRMFWSKWKTIEKKHIK